MNVREMTEEELKQYMQWKSTPSYWTFTQAYIQYLKDLKPTEFSYYKKDDRRESQ